MERNTKGKFVVLAVSFVLFALGAYAIFMDRGTMRTVVLTGCFVALAAIAMGLTANRLKKKGK